MDFDEFAEGQGETAQQTEDIFFLETENQPQSYTTLKDCVIFLIDCTKSMHCQIPQSNGLITNPISSILSIAESFLKTKIITNEKDLFGLVLYNTLKTNNEMNFEGVNKIKSQNE